MATRNPGDDPRLGERARVAGRWPLRRPARRRRHRRRPVRPPADGDRSATSRSSSSTAWRASVAPSADRGGRNPGATFESVKIGGLDAAAQPRRGRRRSARRRPHARRGASRRFDARSPTSRSSRSCSRTRRPAPRSPRSATDAAVVPRARSRRAGRGGDPAAPARPRRQGDRPGRDVVALAAVPLSKLLEPMTLDPLTVADEPGYWAQARRADQHPQADPRRDRDPRRLARRRLPRRGLGRRRLALRRLGPAGGIAGESAAAGPDRRLGRSTRSRRSAVPNPGSSSPGWTLASADSMSSSSSSARTNDAGASIATVPR